MSLNEWPLAQGLTWDFLLWRQMSAPSAAMGPPCPSHTEGGLLQPVFSSPTYTALYLMVSWPQILPPSRMRPVPRAFSPLLLRNPIASCVCPRLPQSPHPMGPQTHTHLFPHLPSRTHAPSCNVITSSLFVGQRASLQSRCPKGSHSPRPQPSVGTSNTPFPVHGHCHHSKVKFLRNF